MGILKENKIYEIRQSSIHNRGAFAVQDIPEGTRVIEYIGDKITKAESEKRSIRMIEKAKKTDRGAVYIFELNKRHDIDGSVNYNIARFINHSCDPNCETDIIRGRIWISALRDIKKAEELSYDYSYDLDDFRDHPCRCGSDNCVGYIVNQEQWGKLKKILTSEKKKKKKVK